MSIDEKYPGGESPIDFYNRIEKNFYEIINENNNLNNIMLVTHSGVINILYHIVRKLEWSNKQKSFPIANTSIHRIIINNDEKIIDIENYEEHLNIAILSDNKMR